MIFPSWTPWLVAAGFAAMAGVSCVGMERAESKAADARATWAAEKADIERRASEDLAKQIEAHNATAKELETIHAQALTDRAKAQEHAASAADAGAAAARAERRLRDIAATTALAASAQAAAAGAAGECQAPAEAARVLADVLGRVDAVAGQLAERARVVSRYADEASAAGAECVAAYEAVRR